MRASIPPITPGLPGIGLKASGADAPQPASQPTVPTGSVEVVPCKISATALSRLAGRAGVRLEDAFDESRLTIEAIASRCHGCRGGLDRADQAAVTERDADIAERAGSPDGCKPQGFST
jgi:hypothetical protein